MTPTLTLPIAMASKLLTIANVLGLSLRREIMCDNVDEIHVYRKQRVIQPE